MDEKQRKLFDLQLFADDEYDDEEEFDEYEEGDEAGDEDGDQTTTSAQKITLTQDEFNQALEKRLARERTKQEKKLAEIFGTKDLNSAGQYYRAGQMLSQATGKAPQEVLQTLQQRMGQQRQGQPGQQQQGTAPPVDSGLAQELSEIKSVLFQQQQDSVKTVQEKEARKEFGALYDEHRDDIEEMAEERGLSLADAGAIVLRPKLRDLAEERAKTKQQRRKKRQVEGTGEAPPRGEEPSAKLSEAQKRVAQKMRMSYKDYYAQLKELGRVE